MSTLDEVRAAPRRERAVHLPGDTNMWVFVLGDLVIFGVYFLVFMFNRSQQPDVFLDSQRHLSLTVGALNTLVLLASSRFVALAVQAARAADHRRASRLVYCGGLCGIVFILLKAGEWWYEAGHGYTLAHNDFFMFYYTLTGVHLVHVMLGLGILAIALRELRTPQLRRVWVVEATATFWHMVDLLWLFIFALLYVMR